MQKNNEKKKKQLIIKYVEEFKMINITTEDKVKYLGFKSFIRYKISVNVLSKNTILKIC